MHAMVRDIRTASDRSKRSIDGIDFREATTADVAAMMQCRMGDPAAGPGGIGTALR
jgi:hypothetical protein